MVKPLDRENEKVPHVDPGNVAIYSCLLLAEDSGKPALTADQMVEKSTSTLIVFVLDIINPVLNS